MRVFFVNQAGNLPPNMVSDYQADMLYHGLFNLDLEWLRASQEMWHMHRSAKGWSDFHKIWGKGFTMYGNLPDDIDTTTTGTEEATHIIVPIHHTLAQHTDAIIRQISSLELLCPQAKYAVIDGWDRTDINTTLLQFCKDKGHKYFKRECTFTDETVKPISFAFPKEKIPSLNFIEPRNYDIAPLIPVNQSIDSSYMSTYIYDDEESYYSMYQDSVFALTSKKGGWDTLRHYEIMANGAIPIFVDIENCPEHTLWNFPKDLCKRVNFLAGLNINLTNGQKWVPGMVLPHCGVINKDNPGSYTSGFSQYVELLAEFTSYFNNNLTTDKLATYVLETMDED